MRYLAVCAFFLTSVMAAPAADVTVLLMFEGESSPQAVESLRAELTNLIKPAGIHLDYRLGSELGPDAGTPSDIIVVRFKGSCRQHAIGPLGDERGPFAFTHSTNGKILPFAEVSCERVQASIRSVSGKLIGNVNDQILGRALGRVVAHEFYHILARTPDHGTKGIARTGLTGAELVAENLLFSEEDLRKFHPRRQQGD